VKVHAGLVGAAIVAALAPTSATAVERWYSNGVFPHLQPLLTSVSNLSPIVFLDALILLAILTIAVLVFRWMRPEPDRRAGKPGGLLRTGLQCMGVAAAVYLLFLVGWGLNYRRVALIHRVRFDATRLSVVHARALAVESIIRLNALYERAHAGRQLPAYALDPELAAAFHAASPQFGVTSQPVLPRPKRSLLDGYFRRTGVAGMTDPFFLEALIASDLLPVERPFVIAHEWSHVAGLADEGEANFAGWLTCLRGTPAHQYSGWLFAYGELVGSLDDRDQRAVAAQLAPGPRDDLRAIRDRLQRNINPRMSAAGWRVYDRYLKANGVAAGAASYSEVVRLMLGADVDMVSWSQSAPAEPPTEPPADPPAEPPTEPLTELLTGYPTPRTPTAAVVGETRVSP
jgi:hypothetical protein